MKVENRDPNLVYPKAVKDEKTRLVLDWLLEFRFSSIDVLAQRIGSNAVNSNRFFNTLLSDGVIQSFKNVHTKNDRYVMLTAAGLSYLEVLGRDLSIATTRVSHLGRYSKIMHDIAVQQAVVKRLEIIDEVVWDKNIVAETNIMERPDALLRHRLKGYWFAIEYERWRKDSKRIYLSFYTHAQAIIKRKYQGVYFIFDKEIDMLHYQKLFDAPEWQRYNRKKSGHVETLKEKFIPDQTPSLRKCFLFVHEPVENV